MSGHESSYPRDWLRIAEKDLSRVAYLLAANDPEGAGFHLQQALEKLLKAFLLNHGWQLRRIHDLPTLLIDAVDIDASCDAFVAPCRRVTGFYMAERYPLIGASGITESDVRRALAEVEPLIRKLRRAVQPGGA